MNRVRLSLTLLSMAGMLCGVAQAGLGVRGDDALDGWAAAPLASARASTSFVENQGQWPTAARFVARTPAELVRLEPGAILVQLERDGGRQGTLVRLDFEGSSPAAEMVGEGEESGLHHFFRGKDPAGWRSHVRSYREVRYVALYPGVDLVVRLTVEGVKYDLVLEPGADLEQVRISCAGAERVWLRDDGMALETDHGMVEHPVGRTFEVDAKGREIDRVCRLVARDDGTIGFEVEGRELEHALVIDPGLVWGTYIGSNGHHDLVLAVDLDPATGDPVFTGYTSGTDFPQTPGAFQHRLPSQNVVFVTRLRAEDGALVSSSLIGGTSLSGQRGHAIAFDPEGRVTVAGETSSADFPVTEGALATVKEGPVNSAFVLRLSADGGTLEYSTFLQGTGHAGASARGVQVAPSGSPVVCGFTTWHDFPHSTDAFQQSMTGNQAAFVLRLTPDGSALEWGTFLGGSSLDTARALALAPDGTVTVVGDTFSVDFPTTPGAHQPNWMGSTSFREAFVSRIAADGTHLVWSTYYGGGQSHDFCTAVGLDGGGGVAIAGYTNSKKHPTTPGVVQPHASPDPFNPVFQDGFVARFDSAGQIIYATYVGGLAKDFVNGLTVDPSGVVTVAGMGSVRTMPGALFPVRIQWPDSFISRLNPTGTRVLYASYLGGPSTDDIYCLATRTPARAVVAGTGGPGWPTTPGSLSPDYIGGQRDGIAMALDMVLQGVSLVGHSTPACQGPIEANALLMPRSGEPLFGFFASAAPPSATGALFLARQPVAQPQPWNGVDLFLDLSQLIQRIPIVTDELGYVETPLPLNHPAGTSFTAQYVFENPPGCDDASPWSASNAVRILVQ